MYRTLMDTAKVTLVLAFAAQGVLTVCGYEVAWVIYGKERIADAQLREIGYCLALVCVALPAWTAVPVVVRGFYALEKTWVPAVLGTAVAIVSYPFYVLARLHLGMYGLAAMSSVAMSIYGIVLVTLLARAVRARNTVDQPRLTPFLARCVVAVLASISSGWVLSALIPAAGTLRTALLRGLATGGVAAVVFFVVSYLVGVEEVRQLLQQVRKRVLPKGS